MKSVSTFRRNFTLLFLLLSLIVSAIAYFAINTMVGSQSRQQQKAMAPIFNLIDEQLLRPLHVTEALAHSDTFLPYLTASEPDKTAIFKELRRLQSHFGMNFFIASEKAGYQYFSDGESRVLNKDSTTWYFDFKDSDQNYQIVFGDQESLSLFIDFKEYSRDGEFLGMSGAALSLANFMQAFERYQRQYGYDFYFVDEQQSVMLTSEKSNQPAHGEHVALSQLDWYQQLRSVPFFKGVYSNLVNYRDREYLVLELPIHRLNWRAYILMPIDQSQASGLDLWRLGTAIFLVIVLLSLVILFFTDRYDTHYQKRLFTDGMTGIANRRYVEKRTKDFINRKVPVSLIIADIDHFKSINDNYGHNAGDKVIKSLGQLLKNAMRDEDVAGRWGGEEFVLLLPNTAYDQSLRVAERLRKQVAEADFTLPDGQSITVTASFGVTQSDEFESLADLVHQADRALYSAKHQGRNRVEGHRPTV